VRIQCERCSTTYELDDSRLPPSGAPVRCTRCQHVFRAFPEGASDKTWLGQPPAVPPADPAAESPRSAPAPSVRPPAAATPSASPAPPARDSSGDTTVTGLAKSLRSRRRRAWMLPAAAVVLLAGAGGAWLALRNRVDPAALGLSSEAMVLLLRDDRASLDGAASKFAGAATAAPAYVAARANRALALLLLSDDAADEARPGEERFRALDAEQKREESERPPGWQSRQAEIIARMRVAQSESQPVRDRSRALREEAITLLRPLARGRSPEVEVVRALAFYYALEGETDRAQQAAGRGSEDPWATLARVTSMLRRPAAAPAGEPVATGERLATAHPEMLRARVTLARALLGSGRRDEAVSVLDGVLATNPVHERAKALKAEILSPPPATVTTVLPAASAPRVQRPGKLPRTRARP